MSPNSRHSLISVALTAVAITVHHTFTIGAGAYALGATVIGLAALFMTWFATTRSRVALAGYLLVSLWIVVGFGLIKGLWDITLPLFLGTFLASISTSFPKPVIGTYAFEASGMLMFIGSWFVAWHAAQMIRERRPAAPSAPSAAPARRGAILAASVAAALAAVAGVYAYQDEDRWVPPRDGVVRIGVIAPVDGPFSILGTSFVKAVEMARDDLGHTKYRYEIVVRDSGRDPAKAGAVIRRVIEQDKVNAILGGISLIGRITKPLAVAARIPHTCVCSVTSIGDGSYNFTNIPSPEAEATRWVTEARRRGIAKVAILHQDYLSINGHVRALKAELVRTGLTITYERAFPESVTDFRAMIAAAKASGPEVYYIESFEPGLDRLAGQLREAGIYNVASVVAPSVSTQPQLFEGDWYTDSDLRVAGFRQRFEDKYPGVQFATHMMPYAYDSFNMIVAAYESGQNPAVYLRNLRMYDGTADTLTKAPGSGNFESRPAVWMIRNGKPTRIG